jgi:hypothetical protein
MRIKVNNFGIENDRDLKGTVWIGKVKQTGFCKYQVFVTDVVEDAEDFDNDDYVIELCKGWFGSENVVCG